MKPSPLPPPLTERPFTADDLRAAGISVERARRADVAHPFHGVHRIDATEDLVDRCRAAALLLDDRHAFSHLTAARLWRMPLPWRQHPGDDLHVVALGARGRLERRGVVSWECDDPSVATARIEGLTVVAPADTWAHLAALPARRRPGLGVDWLVAIGDALVSRRRTGSGWSPPLCGLDDLKSAARRRRGKRGAKSLALALELVRSGPQSPKESLLRVGLTAAGLPEPDIQVPVETARGLRHADLGYPRERLLLEYQGDHHRSDRGMWLDDLTRVQLFQDAGYQTLLIGDHDLLSDCRPLAARIRRALQASRERTNRRP